MEVTTHQRADLRWSAERGAEAGLRAARPKNTNWQWLLILAVAGTPIWWQLIFLVRTLTGR